MSDYRFNIGDLFEEVFDDVGIVIDRGVMPLNNTWSIESLNQKKYVLEFSATQEKCTFSEQYLITAVGIGRFKYHPVKRKEK